VAVVQIVVVAPAPPERAAILLDLDAGRVDPLLLEEAEGLLREITADHADDADRLHEVAGRGGDVGCRAAERVIGAPERRLDRIECKGSNYAKVHRGIFRL